MEEPRVKKKSKRSFVALNEDMVKNYQQIEDQKNNTELELSEVPTVIPEETTNNLQTTFALTNTIVGSACLVLPQNYLTSGLFTSLLVQTLICGISYLTLRLLVIHQKPDEQDVSEIVKRILGKNWCYLFCIASCILLFIAGSIYFLLMITQLYPMLDFIVYQSSHGESSLPAMSEFTFKQFSMQYLTIIMIIMAFPLFCLKNLSFIIHLAQYGVIAIISYVVFVIYIFINNLATGNAQAHWSEFKYFTSDIASIAGALALAFQIHSAFAQVTFKSKKQESNPKNVLFSLMLSYTIYSLIGIFGMIGIVGRPNNNPATIAQFFLPSDWPPFIIETLFLGHLITALPILCFISREQFFNLIYGSHVSISNFAFYGYNGVFSIVCFLMGFFNFAPSKAIGLNGAVFGFVLVFLIPIAVWYSYLSKSDEQYFKEQELQEGFKPGSAYNHMRGNVNLPPSPVKVGWEQLFGYSAILLIGLYLGIIQIISLF